MQRGLEADVPGPRVSFDIVLMSISGTSFKTFPTSLEIVETAPSVAFQRGAEEIVELNIMMKRKWLVILMLLIKIPIQMCVVMLTLNMMWRRL